MDHSAGGAVASSRAALFRSSATSPPLSKPIPAPDVDPCRRPESAWRCRVAGSDQQVMGPQGDKDLRVFRLKCRDQRLRKRRINQLTRTGGACQSGAATVRGLGKAPLPESCSKGRSFATPIQKLESATPTATERNHGAASRLVAQIILGKRGNPSGYPCKGD